MNTVKQCAWTMSFLPGAKRVACCRCFCCCCCWGKTTFLSLTFFLFSFFCLDSFLGLFLCFNKARVPSKRSDLDFWVEMLVDENCRKVLEPLKKKIFFYIYKKWLRLIVSLLIFSLYFFVKKTLKTKVIMFLILPKKLFLIFYLKWLIDFLLYSLHIYNLYFSK